MVKLMRDTPRRREQPPLRCRPGDLAMVTRSIDHYGRDRNMLGLMFRVVALVPSPFGNPCWTYQGPLRETTCGGNTWRIDSVADASLTPLRGYAGALDERSMSETQTAMGNRPGNAATPRRQDQALERLR